MRIEFTIPGKPKGKDRPRMAAAGFMYSPKATEEAEAEIKRLGKIAMGGAKPFTGAVGVEIHATFGVPTTWSLKLRQVALSGIMPYVGKPDVDNIEKLVMDALNGVAWHDDSQVSDLHTKRRYGHPPCVEVTVGDLDLPDMPQLPAEKRLEQRLAKPKPYKPKVKRKPKGSPTASKALSIGRRIR